MRSCRSSRRSSRRSPYSAHVTPSTPAAASSSQALVRLLQERHLDVAQQVGPLLLWLLFRSLSDPLQCRERACSVLCRERVSCSGFSLGRGPSLHRLDGRYPRLRRLLRYNARVRLLDGLRRIVAFAFPCLLAVHHRWRGPVRGLPAPVQVTVLNVPNSYDSGGTRGATSTLIGAASWSSSIGRQCRLPQLRHFRSSIARPAVTIKSRTRSQRSFG